jgi:bleomycin hydrolase
MQVEDDTTLPAPEASMDAGLIARCALSRSTIDHVCFDPRLCFDEDDMTYRTHEEDVVDQKHTGTCWLQAGLAFLSAIARKRGMRVRFSLVHMLFYDKLCKSETFLRSYAAEKNERIRWHLVHAGPVSDGGTWPMLMFLIRKFGVAPHGAHMPLQQASNTGRYNTLLNNYLKTAALRVRNGELSVEDALVPVTRSLQRVYGSPAANVQLNEHAHGCSFAGSPRELASRVRQAWPYEVLCHAPDRALGLYAGPCTNDPNCPLQDLFSCVEMATIEQAVVRQLQAGVPVWFTCDVEADFCSAEGVAQHNLFRTAAVLGLPRAAQKRDRMLARATAPVHAMLLTAVKVVDGRPLQWRIQNSWGTSNRGKGFVTAGHEWFVQNVFHVVVDRCFVGQDDAVQTRAPTKLMPWDLFSTAACC